jgi:hypothetical protein
VTHDVDGQNVTLTAGVAAIGKAISEGTLTFTVETSGGTVVATAVAGVAEATATASVALPGTLEPQALVVKASFSGGPTTLPSNGVGALTVQFAVCLLYDPTKAVKSGGVSDQDPAV